MEPVTNSRWIPGFENKYSITPDGIVYTFKTVNKKPRVLKQFTQMYDYCIINLSKDGKPNTFLIHQLVMSTYGPPRPYPPKDFVITHIDKDKKNNSIDNLAWLHKSKVSKRPRLPVKATGIDDGDVIKFRSVTACCIYFHTSQSQIRNKINTGKPYKGYLFEDLIV